MFLNVYILHKYINMHLSYSTMQFSFAIKDICPKGDCSKFLFLETILCT